MKSLMMGMLAETSLHPGSGQTTGVIDLPVAREATTQYPVIVGSSLKGALRDKAKLEKWEEITQIFGSTDGAGGIAVADGRLLLLPIRSLSGHYRWITCPYILERLTRDLQMIGKEGLHVTLEPQSGEVIVAKEKKGGGEGEEFLFLEELSFKRSESEKVEDIAEGIKPLIAHESVKNRLSSQLVVLHNDDFSHFAQFGLSVQARNSLDENKRSKSLWYEETLPPDTLFYSLLMARPGQEERLNSLHRKLQAPSYLQIGGNETIGQGWCVLSMLD
ncbi:type III-B CRISPR module RAMP protein Cmr4 [Kroppenstedtia eburnea]|uniref:CRISPR-associated protein, Cmr4 family n=1 Tax=Kroppenstedtia eburnea TaxID=714067 RepID=A0A1N7IWP5_9BACL|nr:type III-B CRISPR module RAMP protein Cmr4 [Kroppenstedtia eburnea]QKI82272.1 type III-B CRISPR module RAMP protein Cmr4 [Kroppenstedtia eburnea]SIS41523.1 CRISPR-associated protein, Cmr4 family [Kroppenstedtia eburnea]